MERKWAAVWNQSQGSLSEVAQVALWAEIWTRSQPCRNGPEGHQAEHRTWGWDQGDI